MLGFDVANMITDNYWKVIITSVSVTEEAKAAKGVQDVAGKSDNGSHHSVEDIGGEGTSNAGSCGLWYKLYYNDMVLTTYNQILLT